jgi:FAD/FMN-containing dehydrogenase
MTTKLQPFLSEATTLLGDRSVLTDAEAFAPYANDWRQKFFGKPAAVVFAHNTEQVAQLVRLANQHNVALVPQGGNTGLSGGATPDETGQQVILNLSRMTQIRARDQDNKTITVDAGVTMQTVQEEADKMGLTFPLNLTARGTATIGGNLSTNAGGTAVLRYGNARALCLGVEVVTADGQIWNGLRGLRKDNTGYDLRDLFVGAEGTLGIITGAVMALHPKPAGVMTALACLPDPVPAKAAAQAVALLQIAQQHCNASLTGFEFMTPASMAPVSDYYPQFARPAGLGSVDQSCVLLEVSHAESEQAATEMLERVLEIAMERELVVDALVAQSMQQAQAFWDLREHITMGAAEDGLQVKFDIALPISAIVDFCEVTEAKLRQTYPGVRLSNFGHLGDGNLHFNVAAPSELAQGLDRQGRHDAYRRYVKANEDGIRRIIHDEVVARQGSISAEHGLGILRRDEAEHYKSAVEMDLMRKIKQALDPKNILNPNKVLRTNQ